jgi:hypothetical protein
LDSLETLTVGVQNFVGQYATDWAPMKQRRSSACAHSGHVSVLEQSDDGGNYSGSVKG